MVCGNGDSQATGSLASTNPRSPSPSPNNIIVLKPRRHSQATDDGDSSSAEVWRCSDDPRALAAWLIITHREAADASQSQRGSQHPTHSRRPADEGGDVEAKPSSGTLGRIGLSGYELSCKTLATTAKLRARSFGEIPCERYISESSRQCPS